MSATLNPSPSRQARNAFNPPVFTFKGIVRLLRLTFISGPFLLFTARLSIKNAAIMMLLCAPALLLVFLTTVPALLFTSPEQHAYYEFARILAVDPAQLAVLPLAALCALIALAIPATDSNSFTAERS